MKKILLFLVIAFGTASCRKQAIDEQKTEKTIYIRIESIDSENKSIYSPISVIKIK